MQILSHRGLWQSAEEKNSYAAFERSFTKGFGTETDVRDLAGEIVISHDLPTTGAMTLNSFLNLAELHDVTLALNVKADGLAAPLRAAMAVTNIADWFVFDMSIPDTIQHLQAGNPVFVRVSEFEQAPPFLDQAAGIWFDAFQDDDWRIKNLERWLDRGHRCCIVSPELHKRSHLAFWTALCESGLHRREGAMLCTDLPDEARELFGLGQ